MVPPPNAQVYCKKFWGSRTQDTHTHSPTTMQKSFDYNAIFLTVGTVPLHLLVVQVCASKTLEKFPLFAASLFFGNVDVGDSCFLMCPLVIVFGYFSFTTLSAPPFQQNQLDAVFSPLFFQLHLTHAHTHTQMPYLLHSHVQRVWGFTASRMGDSFILYLRYAVACTSFRCRR